jgi:hypothetical protein
LKSSEKKDGNSDQISIRRKITNRFPIKKFFDRKVSNELLDYLSTKVKRLLSFPKEVFCGHLIWMESPFLS